MRMYHLDVGEEHGAQVKNIVGAIANESGLPSRLIRKVQIAHDHSTVELPADLHDAVIEHLKKTWVCGRPLQIRPLASGDAARETHLRRPAVRRKATTAEKERHETRPSTRKRERRT